MVKPDQTLDIHPQIGLYSTNPVHQGTPSAEGTPESGARAVPARGTIHSAPGQLRASCARIGGGAFPGLGQAGAGNARLEARDLRLSVGAGFFGSCALAASQEAWPGAERKGARAPRARAAVERRQASASRRTRAGIRRCGQGHHASAGVPLPFFVARMERSVIRGRSMSLNAVPGLRCAPSGLRRLIKLGRERAARRISLILPRTQCGGGGPCEAWWRGRAESRIFLRRRS